MYNIQLFMLAMIIYLVSSIYYIANLFLHHKKIASIAIWTALGGLVCHSIALILRTVASYQMGFGQPPFTNLYSSMVFFSWAIVFIYLLFEKKYSYRDLGAFIMPIAFLILLYSSHLPNQIEPLVPALQSKWLHFHVITCFLGYAGFAVAFGIGLIYLVKSSYEENGMSTLLSVSVFATTGAVIFGFIGGYFGGYMIKLFYSVFICIIIGGIIGGFTGSIEWIQEKILKRTISILPNSSILDDLEYKAVAVGFPFLTLGIITGAAWAHYAWGSYWSWDPKETWSLITWFVYAAFLHARFTAGWRGKRTAILSILGFLFVLMTYFGVSFLLGGLHSYA